MWFDEADDGATADLRANSVASIVQWPDAHDDIWPKRVWAFVAGSHYGCRSFDVNDHSNAVRSLE